MHETMKNCPGCNGVGHRIVGSWGAFRLLECATCQLIFSDPMAGGDNDYYRRHIAYQDARLEAAAQHRRTVDKRVNRRLLAMLPAGARTLDVGCGFGAFVDFSCSLGFDAYGIDFNAGQIAAGRRAFGIGDRLIVGSIEDLAMHPSTQGEFDMISMFEVIEHLEAPSRLIADVFGKLKPGGVPALSCPNEDRWQPTGRVFVDYPPHHLTRWRPQALRRFLEERGFEHVETKLDASFADLLWVLYVNQSAKRKNAVSSQSQPIQPVGGRSVVSRLKFLLYDTVKLFCAPFDLGLRAAGVGTMGMRMILRKKT